ncbi:MAG TPA: LON peptidase substrate-binding domain-containing protein, partial [Gaiellaceae bacterium]
MSELLLVPLEDVVVFPNMTVSLDVDPGDEERVLLIPEHEGDYAGVGTVAQVVERSRRGVLVTGLHRGVAGVARTDEDGRLFVEVDERPDEQPPRVKTAALEQEYRAVVEEILELRNADERVGAFLRAVAEAGALADTAGYSPDLTFADKVQLLEALDVVERLELAVSLQRQRLTERRKAETRSSALRSSRISSTTARYSLSSSAVLMRGGASSGRSSTSTR